MEYCEYGSKLVLKPKLVFFYTRLEKLARNKHINIEHQMEQHALKM
jgi:hypothetical protein